jgi:epoxyqueuosine reductase
MPFFGGTDYHAMMGDLSLKHAAVAAGLGEFGLNNLFLAPEYGPRVILAAVVTSAEFEPDPPFKGQLCDLCEECLKICPSGALRNLRGYDRTMGWAMDKHRCHHYIATVLEPTYGHFSCGMCIKACHVGKSEK